VANKVAKCLCILHNTNDEKASDGASLLELENFQESFCVNHDISKANLHELITSVP
jgi:hypothetical protein